MADDGVPPSVPEVDQPGRQLVLVIEKYTPHPEEPDPEDAMRNAYYRLRWRDGGGETGAWSYVVTERIFT